MYYVLFNKRSASKRNKMMITSRKFTIYALFMFVAIFFATSVLAEPYPTRSITMVVPWATGMTDTMIRVISKSAEKELRQPIIVENKTGGSGAIGTNYVLKSEPDGYTILGTTMAPYFVVPHLRKVPYDPIKDICDILGIYNYNFGLAVKTEAPWNSFEDILKYAKENPGKFTYATPGAGTTQHLIMERIGLKERIKWRMIPFKSGGETVLSVLGGHVDGVIQGTVETLPHLKAGKLKLILVLDDKRWPDVPNVPCILEKGYDFYAWNYTAILGPKGLPELIRQKLEDGFKKAMSDPLFLDAVSKFKIDAKFISGREYSKLWRSEYAKTGDLVKALGLKEK